MCYKYLYLHVHTNFLKMIMFLKLADREEPAQKTKYKKIVLQIIGALQSKIIQKKIYIG